jgi:hypothetical protein
LFPAPNLFDDGIRVCGPDKGLWVVIGFGEIAVDGGLEIDDAGEHSALEPLPGQLRKEAFDGTKPGGRGRSEMEMEPRMAFEPGTDLGMLVRGIVVDDQVTVPSIRSA